MIATSPRWKYAFVVLLAMTSSIHAMYFIQNAWLDRDTVQSRTAQLKKQLVVTRDKLANHDRLVERLQEMRGPLAQMENRLPIHLDLPAVEASVREQASLAHVEVTGLEFGAEYVKEGFYAEAPLRLTLRGSTAGLFAFLDQMSRASPLRRIAQMKVEPAEDSAVRAVLTVMYDHVIDEGP
jgi:Tfp pilus assembly protein PilO